MRRAGLRARLTFFFAAGVFSLLILFGAAVLGVLVFVERGELRERQRLGLPPEEDPYEATRKGFAAILLAIPIGTASAAGLGWASAKRALAPLADAGARAKLARARSLELTLPITLPIYGTGDEWDELATTLNDLLADSRNALERILSFTSDAAHELRTPLTAIIGEAELALRRQRSPEELRRALETIHSDGTRLAGLVDALLTLARADAEGLAVRAERTDLDDLARRAVDRAVRLSQQPGRRPVQISLEGSAGLTQGDGLLLSRVIDNLLDNASRHGGEQIEVRLSHAGGKACVDVGDNGGGIPGPLEPRLFERFARGDTARSNTGFGLGLAIARTIVEVHGGSLTLQRARPGAQFRVLLPAAAEG